MVQQELHVLAAFCTQPLAFRLWHAIKNASVKTSWKPICTALAALFLNETADFPFRSVDLSL